MPSDAFFLVRRPRIGAGSQILILFLFTLLLIFKIAGRHFPRAFGERLNRNGHLLGEEERHPQNPENQKQREKKKNKDKLRFQCLQMLFFLFVGRGLALDLRESCQIVAGHLPRRETRQAIMGTTAAREEQSSLAAPNLGAIGQSLLEHGRPLLGGVLRSRVGAIVPAVMKFSNFAASVCKPEGVRSLATCRSFLQMAQWILFAKRAPLACQAREPIATKLAHFP